MFLLNGMRKFFIRLARVALIARNITTTVPNKTKVDTFQSTIPVIKIFYKVVTSSQFVKSVTVSLYSLHQVDYCLPSSPTPMNVEEFWRYGLAAFHGCMVISVIALLLSIAYSLVRLYKQHTDSRKVHHQLLLIKGTEIQKFYKQRYFEKLLIYSFLSATLVGTLNTRCAILMWSAEILCILLVLFPPTMHLAAKALIIVDFLSATFTVSYLLSLVLFFHSHHLYVSEAKLY